MYTVRFTLNAGHDMTHVEFTFIAPSSAMAWAMGSRAMVQLGFKDGDYRTPSIVEA